MSRRFAIFSTCLILAATPQLQASEPRRDRYGDPLPPRAVMRLGTIRLRHADADADVAFSPDSKQLISCGSDGELRFWDAADGRLLQRRHLPVPSGEEIDKTALSRDGALAATRSAECVRLYETRTGKEIGRLAIETTAGDLTFSPDGRFLAFHRKKNKNPQILQVCSTVPFKPLRTLGEGFANPIVFSGDGNRLAGILSMSLHVWDVPSGKEITQGDNPTAANSLALSPDGKLLAVGLSSNGKVWVLDAATLKAKSELKPPANVKAHSIGRLLFAPDGRRLASVYSEASPSSSPECGILIWDVAGAKPPLRLREVYDTLLVFSRDGKMLACHAPLRAEIRLWDVDLSRCRHRWHEHAVGPNELAISSSGKILASSDDEARLCLWEPATGKLRHAFQGADPWITRRCCLSQDGKRLVAASGIGAFQMWDTASGKELRNWQIDPHQRGRLGVLAIGVSPDGSRVAAVAWIKNLREAHMLVWDTNTGKQLCRRPYHREMRQRLRWKENRFPLFCVPDNAFSPDGERVTVWLDDRVGLEQVETGSPLATLPEDVGGPIVFSPDGRLLAAAVLAESNDAFNKLAGEKDVKGLCVIEAATGEEIVRLDSPDFLFAAFTPDGCGLVVTDAKKLCLWNAVTGERRQEMAWPRELLAGRGKAKVSSLAVLPDGRIATGTLDSDILLWDLATTKQPRPEAPADLDETKLAALWADLADEAGKAHRAIAALAGCPSHAVSFLKTRLEPVKLEVRRLDRLLADLDSDSFPTREAASEELTRLRYRADAKMRQALASNPSPEMRRRLEAILARPNRLPTEALRMLRAIALMERIGTPEARRILEKLAGGAAAPETRAAQQALQRLQYR